jgi:transposase
MDMFYASLGRESAEKIRLAVMDMWKPFRQSTQRNAPQAAILFDKFRSRKQRNATRWKSAGAYCLGFAKPR